VSTCRVGERVGVSFLNGHCGICKPCRRGDFVNCRNQHQTGTTIDGGYAEIT
jgi:propanol-preferring alcohol dehydrogenase